MSMQPSDWGGDPGLAGETRLSIGGDVIGVNVTGDKNIIGKNMNVSQTNTEIK